MYTATIQSTLEYGAVTFGMMAPSNIDRLQVSQNQGMRRILGVSRGTSAKMMRHELEMLPVEHRAKLSRDKLYRNIRGNTKHTFHGIINRRQRSGWTTEIQGCYRLVSRQLEEPPQLCRLQVQVSVYCAKQIPTHIRYTQCSILLHIIDICFLPCIVCDRYRKSRLIYGCGT